MNEKETASVTFKKDIPLYELARILTRMQQPIAPCKKSEGGIQCALYEDTCMRSILKDGGELLLCQLRTLRPIKESNEDREIGEGAYFNCPPRAVETTYGSFLM